jgi:molybdenum cofactor biosynthesis enzyme
MIYAFEEIGQDLPLPPLAARRALLGSGVTVPLDTWKSMPLKARQVLLLEGAKDEVSEFVVKNAVSSVLKRVRFMGPVKDPPSDAIPPVVIDALRTVRPLTLDEWRTLRPLDRYTLVAVAGNSRLLYRAIEEMTTGPSSSLPPQKLKPWIGMLAHAEVHMSRPAFMSVASGNIQGGKALVLARVAGVRAARSAHEVLGAPPEKYAGPVEIDARLDVEEGGYVWQAHVSTGEGEFFAAASCLAAATAAIALRDAIADLDPKAVISEVKLLEEAWSVGSGGFGDEATVTINAKPLVRPAVPESAPALETEARATSTGVPVWVALLLVLSALVAFAVAGLTLYKHGGLRL